MVHLITQQFISLNYISPCVFMAQNFFDKYPRVPCFSLSVGNLDSTRFRSASVLPIVRGFLQKLSTSLLSIMSSFSSLPPDDVLVWQVYPCLNNFFYFTTLIYNFNYLALISIYNLIFRLITHN